MMKIIKKYLLQMIEDIDAGNTNIDEKEAIELAATLREYTDRTKRLSKYQACQYLNISRATFDNYVREGRLPKGKKEVGFKELSWYKRDLDDYIGKFKTV